MVETDILKKYIKDNLDDPWKNTFLEGYVFLSPLQKGEFGEVLASSMLTTSGFEVFNPPGSMMGHDRIVNNIKTEIKFSVALRDKKNPGLVKKDTFIINHVSKDKDWERLIFLGINDSEWKENHFLFFTKEDFIKNVDLPDSPFRVQQSGNGGKNDDYMVGSSKSTKFLNCEWVYPITHWNMI